MPARQTCHAHEFPPCQDSRQPNIEANFHTQPLTETTTREPREPACANVFGFVDP